MKALLTGLGIGVGLGVLFAPDSGEATRSKLRERFVGLLEDFGRQVDQAKDVVSETMAENSDGSSGETAHRETAFPPKKDQAREVRLAGGADPINTPAEKIS
jgi:gas vesicle protein